MTEEMEHSTVIASMGFEIGLLRHGIFHLWVKVFPSLPLVTINPHLIILVRNTE